jgi:hypothetical protein
MKITNDSHKLMSFFVENNCLFPVKQKIKTKNIFKNMYNEINDGFNYVQTIKKQLGNSFYKLQKKNINSITDIPRPQTFPVSGFPTLVRKHIDEYAFSLLTYSFNLFEREIEIIFVVEENVDSLIDKYNGFVDIMLVWLYIVNQYSSKKCASRLKIFIYHTSLTKVLPQTNIAILDETHVNTAFTRTCPRNSEIVVFRKEEWFKVFMHETFHNFGLDFSDMNNNACNSKILSIFPVVSDVNLYESYAEFWARIMNILFCSYIHMKNKNDINEFLTNTEYFMNFEILYSFFQMVKVLNFMGLSYKNLYDKTDYSDGIRKTLYKENTNVLSYYVITLILIYNYQDFLAWCNTNNTSLLQFKKTLSNQHKFCEFIEKKYKSKSLLKSIDCIESNLSGIKQSFKTNKTNKDIKYLLTNLRMTVCELG